MNDSNQLLRKSDGYERFADGYSLDETIRGEIIPGNQSIMIAIAADADFAIVHNRRFFAPAIRNRS